MGSAGGVIFGSALLVVFTILSVPLVPEKTRVGFCKVTVIHVMAAVLYLLTASINREFQWEIMFSALLIFIIFHSHLPKTFNLKLSRGLVLSIIAIATYAFVVSICLKQFGLSDTAYSSLLRLNILNRLIVTVLLAPIVEELTFRQALYLSDSSIQYLSLNSMFFAFIHLAYGTSIIAIPILFVLGIVLYRIRQYYGYFAAVLAHSIYNLAILCFEFEFPGISEPC